MTAAPIAGRATPPPPYRFLIVDDSAPERELMSMTLTAAFPDCGVLAVDGPLVAKEMCAHQSFDCVLTDYNMPEMDGFALALELQASCAFLPVVLMTSVGSETLAAEALRCGVSDYIPKSRMTTETVRRSVERSIQASGQARLIEEQRNELENFAYALAHDFKQPIRQITTFSQLISEEITSGDTGGVQQHLVYLSDAARRLGKLVDVMSQYTLLNQPPELGVVDLTHTLTTVDGLLAPYVAERGGEFAWLPVEASVRGNEILLLQVLQNLIINGLQYNRSAAPRVELSAHRDGDHWIIEIEDNGVGIEARYLGDIFKPLVRLHNASEYPGSGLGLTLARKAVLAQKGVLSCESTPGRGSIFRVRLPAEHSN